MQQRTVITDTTECTRETTNMPLVDNGHFINNFANLGVVTIRCESSRTNEFSSKVCRDDARFLHVAIVSDGDRSTTKRWGPPVSENNRAREAPNPVLDINGKIVRASDKYYVVPLQQDQGGGLDLTSRKSQRCPWSVVQDPAYWWGNTIQFYPVNSKKGVIREWTDLNIEFPDISTGCPESNVWTITGDLSSYDGSHYITTGGEIGNPGEQTLGNWIKIVKTTNAYKLMFCPDVCNYCSYVCRDVGISVEGGHRRLVLSDVPLEITFRKA
nr:kunitz trypsin inhibitor 2-like [Ipomoea batatas]